MVPFLYHSISRFIDVYVRGKTIIKISTIYFVQEKEGQTHKYTGRAKESERESETIFMSFLNSANIVTTVFYYAIYKEILLFVVLVVFRPL